MKFKFLEKRYIVTLVGVSIYRCFVIANYFIIFSKIPNLVWRNRRELECDAFVYGFKLIDGSGSSITLPMVLFLYQQIDSFVFYRDSKFQNILLITISFT
jgi:hypothetical protein